MKLLLLIVGALLAVAILGIVALHLLKTIERKDWIQCENVASETPHADGRISRTFSEAVPDLHLLTRLDAAGTASLCGSANEPLGPVMDTPGVGERGTILHLGATRGTMSMIAGSSIAEGARVYTFNNGTITAIGVPTRWLVGRAITAGGIGKTIEVVPCFPVQL